MNFFEKIVSSFLLAVFLLPANAAEEDKGKKSPFENIAYIVTNLQGDTNKYIQVEMSLKIAKPEDAEKIKTFMPVIRDQMILLLSSKSPEQLGSTAGKIELVKESKDAINKALNLTDKDGVSEVLFTSFIIQ